MWDERTCQGRNRADADTYIRVVGEPWLYTTAVLVLLKLSATSAFPKPYSLHDATRANVETRLYGYSKPFHTVSATCESWLALLGRRQATMLQKKSCAPVSPCTLVRVRYVLAHPILFWGHSSRLGAKHCHYGCYSRVLLLSPRSTRTDECSRIDRLHREQHLVSCCCKVFAD